MLPVSGNLRPTADLVPFRTTRMEGTFKISDFSAFLINRHHRVFGVFTRLLINSFLLNINFPQLLFQ